MIASGLQRVLSIIDNQERKPPKEQHQSIGLLMEKIFLDRIEAEEGRGDGPSKFELDASDFFRNHIGATPGSPLIPFHLWEDLFLEGLQVFREFIVNNEADFWSMRSFKALYAKRRARVEEWSKDPKFYEMIRAWGVSGSGGR